jgi:aminopeptidase N
MRSLFVLFLAFIFSASITIDAQNNGQKGSYFCWQKKMNSSNRYLSIFDSPNTPKHKFDVVNYKLNLDIRNCFLSPYPHSYTADEIITFLVDTALNSITLNALNTSLQINSVSLAGVSFTHSGDILTITLDSTYSPGRTVQVGINYQHLNTSDNSFYTGNGGVFTDCEPEGARGWFPCWDKPSDKATLDLTAKVPSNAKLGSNGRLNDSTLTGDTLYYHWISRDPISTYLMVMTGKVNYNLDIVYWHKLSNPDDSIPIRFYYNSGENPSSVKNVILDMTTYYSTLFGEHPFEKNGLTTAPAPGFYWGGMENQTLITFCAGCWSVNLTSHEYAHQWFGDMITCGTWADIWLNEGFATYCEALWYEHTGGYSSYKSDILSDANAYFAEPNANWPMYVPGWAEHTPSIDTLFDYAITYAKGACVLHMLRYSLGDETFFKFIKDYATDTVNFKFGNSVTDDFTAKLNESVGKDISWFIDEWVKQPKHPVYQNIYDIEPVSGGQWQVGFQMHQVQTNTPFHAMPIVVKISFTSGPDTSLRFMNYTNNEYFQWIFDRQPTTLVFDPNNDIVLKEASTILGVIPKNKQLPFTFALHQNFPNPFNPVTRIKFDIPKRSNVTLKIYDVLGRLIIEPVNELREAGRYNVEFDGTNLPSGVYYYKIEAGSFTDVKKMVLIK